jgi:hypothetical protein
MMHSHAQIFPNFTTAFGTFKRSPPGIDHTKKLAPLPTDIFNDGAKLPKGSIQHMFTEHPTSRSAIVQVFHKHHITCITKGVGLFVVKVNACVVNRVVEPSNFKSGSLVVFRWLLNFAEAALLFSTQSALRGNKAGSRATPLFALAISSGDASV